MNQRQCKRLWSQIDKNNPRHRMAYRAYCFILHYAKTRQCKPSWYEVGLHLTDNPLTASNYGRNVCLLLTHWNVIKREVGNRTYKVWGIDLKVANLLVKNFK